MAKGKFKKLRDTTLSRKATSTFGSKARDTDEVAFSFQQFFIDLVGHILYRQFLFPCYPVMWLLYGGRKGGWMAMKNRHFLSFSWHSWLPLLTVVFYMISFYTYVLGRPASVYAIEILHMVLVVHLHSFTVAVKYGFVSRRSFRERRERMIDNNEYEEEMLISGWLNVKPCRACAELRAATERLKVDPNARLRFAIAEDNEGFEDTQQLMHFLSGDPKDFYHCKHLRPSQLPPDDIEQGTANDTTTDTTTNTSSSLPRAPSEVRKRTATSSVCTELVLYDLPMIKVAHYIVANVIQYGRVAKHTMVGLGVIAFLTTLFPGIARMVNGYGFFGSDAASYVVVACGIVPIFFYTWVNYMFLITAHADFARRCTLMACCGGLLTRDEEDKEREVLQARGMGALPVLDLADVSTVRTFLTLRRVLKDWGRRYLQRITMFIGCFFVVNVALIAWFLYELYARKVFEIQTVIIAGTHNLLLGAIFIFLVFNGMTINKSGERHSFLLVRHQDRIAAMIQLRLKELAGERWPHSGEEDDPADDPAAAADSDTNKKTAEERAKCVVDRVEHAGTASQALPTVASLPPAVRSSTRADSITSDTTSSKTLDGLLSPRQLPTQPSSSLKWTKADTNLSALPPPSSESQQLQTQQPSSYNQVMQVDPVLYELTLAKDRLQMLEHEIKLDGDEAPISILGFKAEMELLRAVSVIPIATVTAISEFWLNERGA
ncbi:unnamed protein product [Vitrella brassicaformis CCMP3155]|uniref:Uncharacterized protein n=3 Tax=Vitrella brassicaformis TaxID=1169539 RepID=A0A0G4EPZ0_VITBC|nr:unnamed protein product [Vitrella brassicaformis CCMP3155]|eukprot:CEL99489.1 unnamed protein product [Vitrella brassicaformis CCMP3155]